MHCITLSMDFMRKTSSEDAGRALACILAADAPVLFYFELGYYSDDTDTVLAPIFEALRDNRNLKRLNIAHTLFSAAFVNDVMLPCVRANTGLRDLVVHDEDDGEETEAAVAATQAVDLVVARPW